MKAIAIVALIFAGLSIIIPVGGIFLAMICSVLALISFRSQPTISGITFGINIINTAVLSPSLYISDIASATGENASGEFGDLYLFYVGWHLALFALAITWRIARGNTKDQDK